MVHALLVFARVALMVVHLVAELAIPKVTITISAL
jgi:hypothetical protein